MCEHNVGWVQIKVDDRSFDLEGVVFYEGCVVCLKKMSGLGDGRVISIPMDYRGVLKLVELSDVGVNFFLTRGRK